MTDGFDPETRLQTLASEMIAELMDEPALVAHWLLVVDVRGEDGASHIGVLTPSGMPEWIQAAMLREVGVEQAEYEFVEQSEDEDE